MKEKFLRKFGVPKTSFNYGTESWETREFMLPVFHEGAKSDFVLLTPEDVLTKDETWINSRDLFRRYDHIANSIPNQDIRDQINNYFRSVMPPPKTDPKTKKPIDPTPAEIDGAIARVLQQFPQVIEYYIKEKEEHGDEAVAVSEQRVNDTKELFIRQVKMLSALLSKQGFYAADLNSYDEAMKRVMFLKDVVENNDGYRLLYVDGDPIRRESDMQVIYRLTWFASRLDVNREPNNGRGPVDYAVSLGAGNKSLVEFKLASNSKLKQNLANQVKIYESANNTSRSIKVIFFFSQGEQERLMRVLEELGLQSDKSIVQIDTRSDNKKSASNVTSETLPIATKRLRRV